MFEPKKYHEPELSEEVKLCLTDGRLNPDAVGWSRKPLHNCNLRGGFLRKKRWNYWAVTTKNFLFSATLSNIDYLGLAFVYFLDFETNFFHELTIARPLGKGCKLGNFVIDDLFFKDVNMKLSFLIKEEGTILQVDCPNFNGQNLSANLTANRHSNHESLNVVIPWSSKHFQFTSKENTLPVTGTVKIGDEVFSADGGFACLDFGRGIWPYSSHWNWASSSGISGDHTIGLNFGGGWTDDTGMNENGVCIDGRLSKISEDLVFEYDSKDFMKPWIIRTHLSDQVEVEFTPFFERVAKTDVLILKSEVHQMIGHFSGEVKDKQGKIYPVENQVGWAEEHFARW